jgi:hypothetical protein
MESVATLPRKLLQVNRQIADRVLHWTAGSRLDEVSFELFVKALANLRRQAAPGFTHDLRLSVDSAGASPLDVLTSRSSARCPIGPRLTRCLTQSFESVYALKELIHALRDERRCLLSLLHGRFERATRFAADRLLQLIALFGQACSIVGERTSRRGQATLAFFEFRAERSERSFILALGCFEGVHLPLEPINLLA